MTLLAGTLYDPGTLASKSTAAALAMTALDTTNLRLAFTVPANGAVLVRLRCSSEGATASAGLLLGVLEGSTVRGRISPMGSFVGAASALTRGNYEALFVVPGLTPAANLTWDAAYGVEVVAASGNVRYGGPNDATSDNANGGFQYEIYDCANLLGAVLYDPTTAANKATTATQAMAAFDTANLRITFTAPASGNVLVRMRCCVTAASNFPQMLLGVLDSTTVRARTAPAATQPGSAGGGFAATYDATALITGLTPSSSYTWDAAYGVEVLGTTSGVRYGGPNNTTAGDAFGAFQYEIWAV